jgi:hypothetical protein
MKILLLLMTSMLMLASPAAAQEIGGSSGPPLNVREFDEILLKDGNLLRGRVIEQNENLVIFETESLGRLEIPLASIERIALRDQQSGVVQDPDQNSIMFCPTPATLPRGDSYFRDFQLFFLNFGFGITDAFDLSFGTLFPVSTKALMLSVGGKLRLVDRESAPIGLALTGSFTHLEETNFGAFGAVAGIGDLHRSLNLAVNLAYDDDGDTETIFILGGDVQTGRGNKLFGEYFSSSSLLKDEDDDLKGFINIGFRFFGENHSFSLSGFRPLIGDSDGFIAFPMIMYSKHF